MPQNKSTTFRRLTPFSSKTQNRWQFSTASAHSMAHTLLFTPNPKNLQAVVLTNNSNSKQRIVAAEQLDLFIQRSSFSGPLLKTTYLLHMNHFPSDIPQFTTEPYSSHEELQKLNPPSPFALTTATETRNNSNVSQLHPHGIPYNFTNIHLLGKKHFLNFK